MVGVGWGWGERPRVVWWEPGAGVERSDSDMSSLPTQPESRGGARLAWALEGGQHDTYTVEHSGLNEVVSPPCLIASTECQILVGGDEAGKRGVGW